MLKVVKAIYWQYSYAKVNEIPQLNFTSPSGTCDGDIIQLKFNFTAGSAPWQVSYSVNGFLHLYHSIIL